MKTITNIVIAVALVGCGSANGALESDSTSASRSRAGRTLVEVTRTPEACELATIYFGYDSDDLTVGARDQLSDVATCIRAGRGMPIHLTGAADPRGTEEYNLALGERRALSVRRYLEALGVDSAMVSFSSVGEELARGTNEVSWQLDRHVEPRVRETAGILAQPTASLR
jgi:peptidoglycan-associated lipoprotein